LAIPNETLTVEQEAAINHSAQWVLEHLHKNIDPLQEDLTAISLSPQIASVINELHNTWKAEKEIGFRKTFIAFQKNYPWLQELRSKPLPSRTGTEDARPPSEDEDKRITTGKQGKRVFRTLSMSEIKKLPRTQWHVPGIYQKVSVSLTYGDANTGKTFVDLDMALCMAYGMHWQGRKLEKTSVLYIYGEGNEGLANRVEAWQKYHDKPDTDNIQFICFPVQLMSELEILCATIEDMDEIPAFIVLDTFSVCAEGIAENDNVEVARFIACASHIKRTYKTHVHIIHHAGKNGDYRGAAAFRGNVDTMILLSRSGQDEPIVMSCKKQKDAPYFNDIRLKLEQVEISWDEDTHIPITSCVVVASNAQIDKASSLSSNQQKCLDLLADGMTLVEWKRLAKDQISVSDKTLERCRDFLVEKGLVKKKEVKGKHDTYWHIWPTNTNERMEDAQI